MSSATVRLDHAALRETLRQLFGLPAGSVIDADQLLAPPAIPFMTLRLESSSLLGKVRREFSASGEQESLLVQDGQALGQARFDLVLAHEHVLLVDLERTAPGQASGGAGGTAS
ncbi:TPA: hypothetical protein L5G41_001082 [Pseudomonas aeruginosa]|nr:hypothetical protein [Pseudomonas aeruginosa]HBO9946503.1 hypothetical protein [Pseudomonas aeruginosa]HBO9967865.1 hypothetical protein [Pseudomonas aeruginosa]HBO9990706.1 hypothetical protein [Pseudomonas aeruginosa]